MSDEADQSWREATVYDSWSRLMAATTAAALEMAAAKVGELLQDNPGMSGADVQAALQQKHHEAEAELQHWDALKS